MNKIDEQKKPIKFTLRISNDFGSIYLIIEIELLAIVRAKEFVRNGTFGTKEKIGP